MAYKANADVYAVQGYDAAQILGAGPGDEGRRRATTAMRDAMLAAIGGKATRSRDSSGRGKFTLGGGGNPVQDMRPARGQGREQRGQHFENSW